MCPTPSLDYENFSVAVRFKLESEVNGTTSILVAGLFEYWLAIERNALGNLAIKLSGDREHLKSKLKNGDWNVVALGVDVANRLVRVFANGKQAAEIELPVDFEFDLRGGPRDLLWTFMHWGPGTVMQGHVDELIIYRRMLTKEEFEAIPLQPDARLSGGRN